MNRTTSRAAAALAAALALSIGAAPAHAADGRYTISATKIAVIPGQGNVFHDGDPIRICAGVEIGQATDALVTLSIDERSVQAGSKWRPVIVFQNTPNTISCMYAAVHGHGESKLRVRVHRTRHYPAATSRTVYLSVV